LSFSTVHGVLVVEQEFGERAGKLGLADAGGAQAETLVEALSNAYLINPVLNAERANLRATDEQLAVAKSGLRRGRYFCFVSIKKRAPYLRPARTVAWQGYHGGRRRRDNWGLVREVGSRPKAERWNDCPQMLLASVSYETHAISFLSFAATICARVSDISLSLTMDYQMARSNF
jgi:hypothetical protein